MDSWIIAIALFLLLIAYRFAYYAERARFLEGFLDAYSKYLEQQGGVASRVLLEKKARMKRLISESGVSKRVITRVEPAGFGYVTTSPIDVVENFMVVSDNEIVNNFRPMLREALGYFKWKRNETINPLFWMDFIIRLPKYLMEYFSPDATTGSVYKLMQLGYWVVSVTYMLSQLKIITLPWPQP